MNLIGLSTVTYDIEGDFLLSYQASKSAIHDFDRRVSRTATLDGGGVVTDFGYSETDRDLKVTCKLLNYEMLAELQRVCQSYSQFIVTTVEGAFRVVVSRFRANNDGTVSITFIPIEVA